MIAAAVSDLCSHRRAAVKMFGANMGPQVVTLLFIAVW